MSKAVKPFAYRGKWRIQVTLKNGKRPAENFIKHADALQWAADTLANDNSAHEAQLGGSTQATLAQALLHYAQQAFTSEASTVKSIASITICKAPACRHSKPL